MEIETRVIPGHYSPHLSRYLAMKASILLLTLGIAFAGGACSQDNVVQRQPGKGYGNVANKSERRPNDKSSFKKEPPRIFGTGVDLNANNPYKFRTVKTSGRYKYTNPGRTAKAKTKPQRSNTAESGGSLSTASN
jgi:hypothetical protein